MGAFRVISPKPKPLPVDGCSNCPPSIRHSPNSSGCPLPSSPNSSAICAIFFRKNKRSQFPRGHTSLSKCPPPFPLSRRSKPNPSDMSLPSSFTTSPFPSQSSDRQLPCAMFSTTMVLLLLPLLLLPIIVSSSKDASCDGAQFAQMPCRCCKMDCWYSVAGSATHELGHIPGEAGEQEAMATLRLIRACMIAECTPMCGTKKGKARQERKQQRLNGSGRSGRSGIE